MDTGRISAIILAGGKSSRFGSDKAWALLDGQPLVQHVAEAAARVCAELVIVHARGQALPPIRAAVPVRTVEDRYEALGPLAGMVTGFEIAAHPIAFVTSTDAPLLQPALIEALALRAMRDDFDIVCPRAGGYSQPLLAVYRPSSCLPRFRGALEGGERKITNAFAGLAADYVDEQVVRKVDPELLSFRNANTPAALDEIAALVRSRRA